MIVLALFAVVFAIVGCVLTFAPRWMADYLTRHNMPVRIGSTVETTPRNVRSVGVLFLGFAILLVVLDTVVATVPDIELPFA
ncbi:MAG TPA: hypothetical protein VN108_01705 [Marmoricola sp.]|nr:hypothetical protein [Marmoricola sp.]